MKPVFNSLRNQMSSDSVGSAILLGLNGGALLDMEKQAETELKMPF